MSRLKTKTDKKWTKDKLTASLFVCFSGGSSCCCECGGSLVKKNHKTFSENCRRGAAEGELFVESGIIYAFVLSLCSAKPSKES